MAQVDQRFRLRDLVYQNIISIYNPELCLSFDYTPIGPPAIQFLRHAVFIAEGDTRFPHEVAPDEIKCTYVFSENNIINIISGTPGIPNSQIILNENSSENRKVGIVVRSIRLNVKYPTRCNAFYAANNQAHPDLAAVFLALRARIERLRAFLQ